ncbi:MAG: PAC2 family protein [Thermoplasmata archaeon]
MKEIEISEMRRMDLEGATVIDGFPSVGLVSSIATNYIIKLLNMQEIGVMDSDGFPHVTLVRDAVPLSPVRIYAGDRTRKGDLLVAFVSEFQSPPDMIRPISKALLNWAAENRCKMIISPEGLIVDPELKDKEELSRAIFAIGSTDHAREIIRRGHFQTFDEGVITGVAGMLLIEGMARDFDVITLLAEAHPDFPDAGAAALVLEAIDDLVLGIDLDAEPLFKEAQNIEARLRDLQAQAIQKVMPKSQAKPSMYG